MNTRRSMSEINRDINKDFINATVTKFDKADKKSEELTQIPVYMEQLINLLDSYAGIEADSKDANGKQKHLLSQAMINSYRKEELIPKLDGKKYTSDHIMLLLLISQLKNVLTINEIKQLFTSIFGNFQGDSIISIKECYDLFQQLLDIQYKDAGGDFEERFNKVIKSKTQKIEDGKKQDLAEVFLTVMMLVAEANVSKKLAETIIAEFLAAPQINKTKPVKATKSKKS